MNDKNLVILIKNINYGNILYLLLGYVGVSRNMKSKHLALFLEVRRIFKISIAHDGNGDKR